MKLWKNVLLCEECWVRWTRFKGEPGREPARAPLQDPEACYGCDCLTDSGIYVRVNVEW